MAKGNPLNGTASGRLGDTVSYRTGGEQRSRILVKPHNPKTQKQLLVRNQWCSVSNAYNLFMDFVSGSMKCNKHKGYNEFVKHNVRIAPYLTKAEYDYRHIRSQAKIAPYVVSWGDLQNIWSPIAKFYPYVNRGQRSIGMTVVIRFEPNYRRLAFSDISEGNYHGSLNDLITRIATTLGFPNTHLGLFVASGPRADEYGLCYDTYNYAELWRYQDKFDIPVSAQYLEQERTWNLQIDQNPVYVRNWQIMATATSDEITIIYSPA